MTVNKKTPGKLGNIVKISCSEYYRESYSLCPLFVPQKANFSQQIRMHSLLPKLISVGTAQLVFWYTRIQKVCQETMLPKHVTAAVRIEKLHALLYLLIEKHIYFF